MPVARWRGLGIAVALGLVMLAALPARAGAPSDQLRTQIERVLKVLYEAGQRDSDRVPDAQQGRPVARLRRDHRRGEPGQQLPHAVQQDHPDELLPGAREEDEDAAGRVPGRRKAAAHLVTLTRRATLSP